MTPPKHLFLVEDDVELASLIREFLMRYGFLVTHIDSGEGTAEAIIQHQPDLVILDVMLPGVNGMDICRQIRAEYQGLILMQTALDDDIDQMMGLELGADDYVIKQVQPRLLLSRINALLRRDMYRRYAANESDNEAVIKAGDLHIDLTNRSVTIKRKPIDLTTAEYELLCFLARSVGRVVRRDDIVQELRGYEYDGLDRSIDRRISRLRRKLGDDSDSPQLIKTIRGNGLSIMRIIQ